MQKNGAVNEIITGFLKQINIDFKFGSIEGDSFMPGVGLQDGVIVIDTEKLIYPGDILHEAGHIATTHPDLRGKMDGELPKDDHNLAGEIMSQAWCYAACLHLGLDPAIVFHDNGYRGLSKQIIQGFEEDAVPGLLALQWLGMAYEKRKATELNVPPYPHMTRWTRQNEPR